MSAEIPASVLQAFPLGSVSSTSPIHHGLIHATYRVQSERGAFVLQRLHPVLASVEAASDFLHVTEFLNAQGFPAPRCVPSLAGPVLVNDAEGRPWRLQTFLPGQTVHRVQEPELAGAAGTLYARFHRVMSGFPHAFESRKILHDTPRILAAFNETATRFEADPLMHDVEDEVRFVATELPGLLLPEDLPLRVIHGDPKVSNILFEDGKASALVDLDTCNRRPLAVELGDAFRSWCAQEEDRTDNVFRLDVFAAGWQGYAAEAGDSITAREKAVASQGIGLITLELASRFLADYFNDAYFGWDQSRYPSRRAHNLARARGQIALYRDFARQRGDVEAIIHRG